MIINVSKLRSHYPEFLGIRKYLQKLKVKRITRFTLHESEIAICESNNSKKQEMIAPYLKRWKRYLRPCLDELESMVENAPIFNKGYNIEPIKTDILFCRLAYGFLPSEYIGFSLHEKSPEERKKYCSDLDASVFGYTVNNIVEVQRVLNKATSAEKYKTLFKRDFIIVRSEHDFDKFCRFVKKHPMFVKKKIFSSMGKGVELINISDNNQEEYFSQLVSSGEWLLEEKVIQRPEMACFNSSSVNTVRCITFKTNQGVVVPYCFMRAGRNGSFVDNGGSGGLLIGIDVEEGILDTDAYDEYGRVYNVHPDSKVKFIGFKIPEWEKLLQTCKVAAAEETDMAYLSWDMAYTNRGWSVIEVNEVGQFVGPQIVYRRGIKSELKRYLDIMPKVI